MLNESYLNMNKFLPKLKYLLINLFLWDFREVDKREFLCEFLINVIWVEFVSDLFVYLI